LHLDSLYDQRTKAKIHLTLDNVGSGAKSLDDAYTGALRRIAAQRPGDYKLAKTAISWITWAYRPLTTEELCHALAIEPGDRDLNTDNILEIDDILSVCAGLLTVDQGSNIVRFVHQTTQEYFERIRGEWNTLAQQQIASACLAYLTFPNSHDGCCDNEEDLEKCLEKNILYGYSAQYWGQHARDVQEQVSESALAFLCEDDWVSRATQAILDPLGEWGDWKFPTAANGLHLTARFGLGYLLKKLLSRPDFADQANTEDSDDRTPLILAAMNGHEMVVQNLIEREDVDADAKDKWSRTALSWAAEKGHKAVVRQLTGIANVDVNTRDKDGKTPLIYASRNGHKEITELLVARGGIDINAKDDFYGQSPLAWAAENGYREIVELLMAQTNIELNSKDKDYGQTPLYLAARKGQDAIVKLLLEQHGVDTNLKDTYYGQTPLSWASENGHEAVVKMLIERDDVDVNAKDLGGRTPLGWAARNGHEEVVKLLLSRRDVDIHAKDNCGWSPHTVAKIRNHKSILKYLTD
jgi:ankyrin repeat protein